MRRVRFRRRRHWKVFGQLSEEYIREQEIDDRLIVVGKIKRKLVDGKWRPLLDIRGFDYPNRAERRRRLQEVVPERSSGSGRRCQP
jgi:hypothetical protein